MKSRVASVVPLLAVLALAAALAGCFSMPVAHLVRAYPGADRPDAELSFVVFQGSGFPDIYLYRVDGKPRLEPWASMTPATYTDEASLGFNVAVLPGEHVLEFYNVHKTPFDKAPLVYRTIRFATVAGKTYTLEHAADSWQVTSDGAVVPSVLGMVPVLDVPAAGQPRATLTFEKGSGGIAAYVLRIDGKISPAMQYLEPRWVCFNDTSGAPNVDPNHGKLEIDLAPGRHVVEYVTDYFVLAARNIGNAVRIVEFEAVGGKTYRIEVDPGTGELENGFAAKVRTP